MGFILKTLGFKQGRVITEMWKTDLRREQKKTVTRRLLEMRNNKGLN